MAISLKITIKSFIWLFIFLHFTLHTQAQTNYNTLAEKTFQELLNDPTQSVKKIEILKTIPNQEADTTRYRAYTCVGVYYGMLMQHDSSLRYLYKAKDLIATESIQMARTKQKIAIVKRLQGNYHESLSILSEALPIAQNAHDNLTAATILSEIATNHNSLYNKEAAIKYLIKSINEIENMPEPELGQLAIQKHNLANFYSQNQNFEIAEKLFLEAINLFKKLEVKQSVALGILNYGELLLRQKKYRAAEKNLFEALKLLQTLGNQELVAIAYLNIAILYEDSRLDDEQAQKYFQRALEVADKIKSARTIEIFDNYLMYLIKKQRYSSAILLNEKYKKYATSTNINVLYHYHKHLGEAYEAIGDFKNASIHFNLFGRYGDSLIVSEKKFIVSQIHENYEQELQKKENEKLAQNIELIEKESEIKLFILLSIAGVLLTLSIFLWSKSSKAKQANEILSLKIKVEEEELRQVQNELNNERALLKLKEEIISIQKKELFYLSKQGSEIVAQLDELLTEKPNTENKKTPKSIKDAISNQFWEQFSQRFQSVYPHFYMTVHTKFGHIFTEEELQHLALHKIGLSLSEIAYSLSISAVQAELTRQNIRKKCDSVSEDQYEKILAELG